MSWLPVPARRLALTLAVIFALLTPERRHPVGVDPVRRRHPAAGARGDQSAWRWSFSRRREVPPLLAQAVVATEDERFYSHHGIDSIGLGRAFLYDATNFCLCQGGSTITEQLVKDVYLGGSDDGLQQAGGHRPRAEGRAGDRQAADPGGLPERDHDRPQPLRRERGGLRLLPRAARQPDARPVRAARRRHPGTVALRPDGRPRAGEARRSGVLAAMLDRRVHHARAGRERQQQSRC